MTKLSVHLNSFLALCPGPKPLCIVASYHLILRLIIHGRRKFAYAAMAVYSMTLSVVIVCIEMAVNE